MRCVLAYAVSAFVLWVSVARAQEARIGWDAPEPCPSEAVVRQTVSSWIAQSPERLDVESVHARALVFAEGADYVLELDVATPGGTSRETLRAERCEALVQVVALKIALAAIPVEPVPVEAPPPDEAPLPRGDTGQRSSWGFRVPVGVSVGLLPAAAPFVGLTGLFVLPRFQLELAAAYTFQQQAEYAEVPGIGADIDLLSVTGRACPRAQIDVVEIQACAGLAVGAFRGSGFGVDAVRTAYEPWLAFEMGPALSFPIAGSLRGALGVDAMLSIVRPAFRMRNLPRLHQPEASAVQGWAGVEYVLP